MHECGHKSKEIMTTASFQVGEVFILKVASGIVIGKCLTVPFSA